ncbi:methyltransferase [Micromonospora vinacea]|uniref:methyltransferase n=1 Tax=Micromonospora vinacea TaxID=709878 RepID=UPI0034502ECD
MARDEMSARIWSMAGLGTPMAIRTAATLRLADHIDAGADTAEAIAGAEGVDADALERVMRYLAVRGLLVRESGGRYALTPLGAVLREDHPSKARARLDIEGSVGRAELSFVQLLHSVRTGEAGFPVQFGRSFWEDWAADPERAANFNRLTSDLESRSPEIVEGMDWGPLGWVVDVGGGNGALLIGLLNAYPTLRGTVLEMPDNCETARKSVAESGLGERLDVVAGSFFDPLPAGAGGYVLSFVLHNWADGPAREILRRCAQAAGQTGAVLVVEQTGPGGEATHTGMDLRMLTACGGRERTAADLTALAASVGLHGVAVHPAGSFSIVELRAAG